MKKYKAISYAIFTGSNYIGAMRTGRFDQDKILENSDECFAGNSKHLHENYKDTLEIVKPMDWKMEGYLGECKKCKYDYLYANPNCSGLSRINRNANADHYRNFSLMEAFENIKAIKPKTFFVENAPSLSGKLGWPILAKMAELLGDEYTFNVTRDYGKFHNVAMGRHRTLVTGYRKDAFDNKCFYLPYEPVITKNLLEEIGCELQPHDEGVFEYEEFTHNMVSIVSQNKEIFEEVVNKYKRKFTILSIILSTHPRNVNKALEETYDWDKIIPATKMTNEKHKDSILRDLDRKIIKLAKGGGVWDKSPTLIHEDVHMGVSLTALAVMYNFEEHRLFNIREYANMMGYPKEFVFEKGVSIGHIAQGVPANFAQYVHEHIANVLDGKAEGVVADTIVQLSNKSETRSEIVDLERFKILGSNNNAFIKVKGE